jgi:hypothetical protein
MRRAGVTATALVVVLLATLAGSVAPARATAPIEPIDAAANWDSIWATVAPGGTTPLDLGGVYGGGGSMGTAAQQSALRALLAAETDAGTVAAAGFLAFSPVTIAAGAAVTALIAQHYIQNFALPPAAPSLSSYGVKLYGTATGLTQRNCSPGGCFSGAATVLATSGQTVWYVGAPTISGWSSGWQTSCASEHCGWNGSGASVSAALMGDVASINAQARSTYGLSDVVLGHGIAATGYGDSPDVDWHLSYKVAPNPGYYASGAPRHCGGSGEPLCSVGYSGFKPATDPTNPGSGSATATAVRNDLKSDEGLREAVNHALAPTDPAYPDPVTSGVGSGGHASGSMLTIPECVGSLVAVCVGQLDDLGIAHTVVTLDKLAADVTKPAGAVVTTSPAGGSTVPLATPGTVTITANPDPLPILLPQPMPNETYDAYIARLAALGYVGTVTRVELSPEEEDTHSGPNAPARVRIPTATGTQLLQRAAWPGIGALPRVWPSDSITVYTNPETAPDADTPDGSDGGIDFGPLTGLDPGCKFPFGLFCYAKQVTNWFIVSPQAPAFHFTFATIGGFAIGGGGHYDVDLGDVPGLDGYMAIWRTLLSIALWVGAVWVLASRFLGLNLGDPGEAVDDP